LDGSLRPDDQDAVGVVTTYVYDASAHLTSATYADGSAIKRILCTIQNGPARTFRYLCAAPEFVYNRVLN
jgi:YD repeat-containing protein